MPLLQRLAVRAVGMMQPVGTLSGGNQQKVVLARCLSVSPRLLLLDEPTRGIDVRTKAELYTLIEELAASGMTVVFASSELPEVLALASTVLVMAHGQQTLLLPNAGLSEAQVLAAAFHVTLPPTATPVSV
jgi:ribose transport system ATP-binding protein